jgi:hypothetical protein
MRELGKFVLLLGVVAAVLLIADKLIDRTATISVVADAPLYSLPPQDYPANNPCIAILKRGEPVKVLRVAHGKDFQTFRVETQSGQIGWVILGQGIQSRSRNQHDT